MLKIVEIKSNEPKLTQKEISKQTGLSDSTIKRFKDDKNMDNNNNGKTKKRKMLN